MSNRGLGHVSLAREMPPPDDPRMTDDAAFDHAILTVAEMAAADRATIAAGTSGLVLMKRAGQAVAEAVARHLGKGARVLVLCGPGNNGGDGFVAARLLRERGFTVTVAATSPVSSLSGDAAAMAAHWAGPVAPAENVLPADHDLVVDALFGAGLSRALDARLGGIVSAINAAGKPVIAVDVPSGLFGDTGQAAGIVVKATETVTFFRLKPGHLLEPGRTLCGKVTLADIGIAPATVFAGSGAPRSFRNAPGLWRHSWPSHGSDTHKFRRGAVLVLAGGLSGVGAPRLAARASLRSGAGLVTIACRPEALAAHAARGPDALMQRAVADLASLEALLADRRLAAAAAGPALGLDAQAEEAVLALLRSPVPLVLDADALTLLAGHSLTFLKAACQSRSGACVFTPHEGEFARLFGGEVTVTTQASKLERARQASALTSSIVVLKGADTVIASPDGRAAINTTGSAALATAGSGDVLGGLIAGLLAQGMPGFEAACAAVWLHGKAGEKLGLGLIADDLPETFPGLIAEVSRAFPLSGT
jgi:hydroxyethylthiazole kinase-like uncharacterized protein yjeF